MAREPPVKKPSNMSTRSRSSSLFGSLCNFFLPSTTPESRDLNTKLDQSPAIAVSPTVNPIRQVSAPATSRSHPSVRPSLVRSKTKNRAMTRSPIVRCNTRTTRKTTPTPSHSQIPELVDHLSSPDTESSPESVASPEPGAVLKQEALFWKGLSVPIEYKLGTVTPSLRNQQSLTRMLSTLEGLVDMSESQPEKTDHAMNLPSPPPKEENLDVVPFSFYHILYQYQTVALHVRPISWTDKHCEAFRIKWEEESTPAVPKLPETAAEMSIAYNRILRSCIQEAFYSADQAPLASGMTDLLWRLFPDCSSNFRLRPDKSLIFWLGGKGFNNAVHTFGMWDSVETEVPRDADTPGLCSFTTESTIPFESDREGDTEPAPSKVAPEKPKESRTPYTYARPKIAFINRDKLCNMRNGMYRVPPHPGKKPNTPILSLHRMRAKKLKPEVANEDAYIAAMFIAMAQKHFYPIFPMNKVRESAVLPFHDLSLRIIATCGTFREDKKDSEQDCFFVVYKATVTAELLRGLHNPRNQPMPGFAPGEVQESLKISYQTIPVFPLIGLRERMAHALGDVIGQVDLSSVETWSDNSQFQNLMFRPLNPMMMAPRVYRRCVSPNNMEYKFFEQAPAMERTGAKRRLTLDDVVVRPRFPAVKEGADTGESPTKRGRFQ